jgi:hypothetical protein
MIEGKIFAVVLSNDPQVIDRLVCTNTVDPDMLLTFHSPYGSWSADPVGSNPFVGEAVSCRLHLQCLS